MTALARRYPFKELDESQNRLRRLFGPAPVPPENDKETNTGAEWAPLVDITEGATEFLIKAELDQAWNEFGVTADQLAMKGLDVDPIHDKLNELADSLKQARSHIHSFSKNDFQRAADPGEKAVLGISRLVEEAKAEYRFRQLGLVTTIALMGLVMLALYVKLRRLER